jgi:hypothetical protein
MILQMGMDLTGINKRTVYEQRGGESMKTRKSILALVILLVLVFMHGQTEARFMYYSGTDLVEYMREYEKGFSGNRGTNYAYANFFTGYVTGVCDLTAGVVWQDSKDVTSNQAWAIVAKYLKNHPERWNESAAVLVVDALKEAFPLKK